jgi:hypothetical protein
MQKSICFPTTIIDGFFDDPDKIREFALKQEFKSDPNGRWPGERSENLENINNILFQDIVSRMLSLFFSNGSDFNYRATSKFQLVNGNYKSGWVHQDLYTVSSIIYLTPGSTSGTSLYSKKNIEYNLDEQAVNKIEKYIRGTDDPVALKINNNMFEETLNIKGLYNRMILFDSSLYHAAHDFFGCDKYDSRLTLNTFIISVSSEYPPYPIVRSKMKYIV